MDKNWLKLAMTTIYTNNYFFPRIFLSKISKTANRKTMKVLLINNLQTKNTAQLTSNLTVQRYQIKTNTTSCFNVKMLTSNS